MKRLKGISNGLLSTLLLLWASGSQAQTAFNQTNADEITSIGPGQQVTVQIGVSGQVGSQQIEISLAVSPASAFDLAATAYEVPIEWFTSGPSSVGGNDTAANLFSAVLTTAADFTPQTTATIAVEKIAVGTSSSEINEFDGSDLGIGLIINPSSTAVEHSEQEPTTHALAQNFPNPFNPGTNIRFDLSEVASVTLTVYDVAGQTVRTLVAGQSMEAGIYNLTWDGRNTAGDQVGSGIYFYQLQAGSFTSMKKMTLLK